MYFSNIVVFCPMRVLHVELPRCCCSSCSSCRSFTGRRLTPWSGRPETCASAAPRLPATRLKPPTEATRPGATAEPHGAPRGTRLGRGASSLAGPANPPPTQGAPSGLTQATWEPSNQVPVGSKTAGGAPSGGYLVYHTPPNMEKPCKSWEFQQIVVGLYTPAAWQAVRHAVRQRRTGMPSRWKTSGLSGSRRARRRTSASAMGCEMGRIRPTRGHCQVDGNHVDRPPRYWALARREPTMLGIKNSRQPQLDNTLPSAARAHSPPAISPNR